MTNYYHSPQARSYGSAIICKCFFYIFHYLDPKLILQMAILYTCNSFFTLQITVADTHVIFQMKQSDDNYVTQ